jgi:hypothetical protein
MSMLCRALGGGEWVLPFCRDATPLARAKWSSEDKAAACGARKPAMDPASSGCGVLVSTDQGLTWTARAPASLATAKSAAAAAAIAGGPGGWACQISLATSSDAVSLKKRGFSMR